MAKALNRISSIAEKTAGNPSAGDDDVWALKVIQVIAEEVVEEYLPPELADSSRFHTLHPDPSLLCSGTSHV